MITEPDYWMGRDRLYPAQFTPDIQRNGAETVARVNALLRVAKVAGRVSSGWRPAAVNAATPRAARRSRHITAEACDLQDPKGDLGRWCLDNLHELERIGLWLETPGATPGWCHLQIVPPGSGRRVFRP